MDGSPSVRKATDLSFSDNEMMLRAALAWTSDSVSENVSIGKDSRSFSFEEIPGTDTYKKQFSDHIASLFR